MSMRARVKTAVTDDDSYVDTKTGDMLPLPPDGADTVSHYAGIFIRERDAEEQHGRMAVLAQDAYLQSCNDKSVQFPEHGYALVVVQAERSTQDMKAIHDWIEETELTVEEMRVLLAAAKGFNTQFLHGHLRDAIGQRTAKVANRPFLKRDRLAPATTRQAVES